MQETISVSLSFNELDVLFQCLRIGSEESKTYNEPLEKKLLRAMHRIKNRKYDMFNKVK